MCGIIGIIGKDKFLVRELLNRLKRLEYRGYDSAGFAMLDGTCKKAVGYVDNLIKTIDNEQHKPALGWLCSRPHVCLQTSNQQPQTSLAIAHTRWATHGGVLEKNAHPHFDSEQKIFVIHNGIIDNYAEIKNNLISKGYTFYSDTDTEVIPNYFCEKLKTKNIEQAMVDFMKDIKGTFAILLFRKGEERIFALKRDSPLALGICKDKLIVASDIYAFGDLTDKTVFFEDNEFAVIDKNSYIFYDKNGKKIKKSAVRISQARKEETKESYQHFMLKEIKEQPETSLRLVNSLMTTQKNKITEVCRLIKSKKRVVFLSCGTSYHASLVGVSLLTKLGIEAHAVIASEFENFLLVDKDTLVISISQSGETMDVISVLKKVKDAIKVAIVNVPYSTIQRLSNLSLDILAGQEICVASTKAFTNQLIILYAIAKKLGYNINLGAIPKRIKETIDANESKIKELADKLYKEKNIFVLGKGSSYPLAREVALKLKEISYIHAEGMMAGELKHGTIALIENGLIKEGVFVEIKMQT